MGRGERRLRATSKTRDGAGGCAVKWRWCFYVHYTASVKECNFPCVARENVIVRLSKFRKDTGYGLSSPFAYSMSSNRRSVMIAGQIGTRGSSPINPARARRSLSTFRALRSYRSTVSVRIP